MHQIKLYSTTWNNQWNLYGSYLFKTYDTIKNKLSDIDFMTSFMNFQMPLAIEYFKNSLVNNPLEVQSFNGDGVQLSTFKYEYEHTKDLRVKRIQKEFLDNQIVSANTWNYFYQQ